MSEILDPIPTEEEAQVLETAAEVEETAELISSTTENVVEETAELVSSTTENVVEETASEVEETVRKTYANREEILDRLNQIVASVDDKAKAEINYLKMLYYKMREQETNAELQKVLDGEVDAAQYQAKPDELEARLKELLQIQKDARAKMVKEREDTWAANLSLKEEILAQMEALAQDASDVNQHYNEYIALQKKFKEVGDVDPKNVNDLWKKYNLANEHFYDMLKINKELRDYDFKKNLEKKTALCEEAERLADMGDVLAAFRRLQELHDEWKALGPVAPDVRESIWERFRAASTVVNKRHQDHFDQLKEAEKKNEEGKNALIARMEAIDLKALTSAKEWDSATQQVLDIQKEWRAFGFASKKINTKLFERYRELCDAFFAAKAEFYKDMKDVQKANLARKIEICEKAEALKDSTEWRTTTDKLVNLQKEWKTIGAVPHKDSNAVWKRFSSACDAFFAAKDKAVGGERAVENENLAKKQEIIARLEGLKEKVEELEPKDIRDIMAEWNAIGHVPFKEKDKLFARYQEVLDFFYDKLDMKGTKARINNFRQRVKKAVAEGGDAISSERQKLRRDYERLSSELATYENNLGFLTLSSKHGSSLLAQMERKRDELKERLAEVVAKIKTLDEEK